MHPPLAYYYWSTSLVRLIGPHDWSALLLHLIGSPFCSVSLVRLVALPCSASRFHDYVHRSMYNVCPDKLEPLNPEQPLDGRHIGFERALGNYNEDGDEVGKVETAEERGKQDEAVTAWLPHGARISGHKLERLPAGVALQPVQVMSLKAETLKTLLSMYNLQQTAQGGETHRQRASRLALFVHETFGRPLPETGLVVPQAIPSGILKRRALVHRLLANHTFIHPLDEWERMSLVLCAPHGAKNFNAKVVNRLEENPMVVNGKNIGGYLFVYLCKVKVCMCSATWQLLLSTSTAACIPP